MTSATKGAVPRSRWQHRHQSLHRLISPKLPQNRAAKSGSVFTENRPDFGVLLFDKQFFWSLHRAGRLFRNRECRDPSEERSERGNQMWIFRQFVNIFALFFIKKNISSPWHLSFHDYNYSLKMLLKLSRMREKWGGRMRRNTSISGNGFWICSCRTSAHREDCRHSGNWQKHSALRPRP